MAASRRRRVEVRAEEIPVSRLIDSYLLYQEDRNHSQQTVEWYAEKLGRFAKFLGADATLKDITLESFRAYQRWSRSR